MYQKIYPKLKVLSLDLSHSNTIKNQNKYTYFFLHYLYLSQIYPKFNFLSLYLTYSNTVKIPNASEMYPKFNLLSLDLSHSNIYYKNQNKHTYFFLYYLYLSQCPGTNVSRCLFQYNMSQNINNHYILLRQLVPRHIHISSYITYIYPKFIPNSTFSLPISHLLKYCKDPKCIK